MKPSQKNNSDICILVPFYNEEKHIFNLLTELAATYPYIIAIDDGSTDNSASEVHKIDDVILLEHPKNRGKGAAIKTGLKYIDSSRCSNIVIMDADYQHLPSSIEKFINHIESNKNTGLILGVRNKTIGIMPLHRIISNTLTSYIVSFRTFKRFHDSQCGFRCLRVDFKDIFYDLSDGWGFETEFLIRAVKAGLAIDEISIPTLYGEDDSKMNNSQAIMSFISALVKKL